MSSGRCWACVTVVSLLQLISNCSNWWCSPALSIMPWAKADFCRNFEMNRVHEAWKIRWPVQTFLKACSEITKRSGQLQQTSFPNNIQLFGWIVTRAYLFADLVLSVQCRSPKVLTAEVGLLLSVMFFWSAYKVGVTSENYETFPAPINLSIFLSFIHLQNDEHTPKHGAVHCKRGGRRKKRSAKMTRFNLFKVWRHLPGYSASRRHATGVN